MGWSELIANSDRYSRARRKIEIEIDWPRSGSGRVELSQEQKDAIANTVSEWDSRCYHIASLGLDQVLQHLERTVQNPLPIETIYKLAIAVERLQKIGRTALGQGENINLKIDYSKLSDEQLIRLANGEDPRNVVIDVSAN